MECGKVFFERFDLKEKGQNGKWHRFRSVMTVGSNESQVSLIRGTYIAKVCQVSVECEQVN